MGNAATHINSIRRAAPVLISNGSNYNYIQARDDSSEWHSTELSILMLFFAMTFQLIQFVARRMWALVLVCYQHAGTPSAPIELNDLFRIFFWIPRHCPTLGNALDRDWTWKCCRGPSVSANTAHMHYNHHCYYYSMEKMSINGQFTQLYTGRSDSIRVDTTMTLLCRQFRPHDFASACNGSGDYACAL